MMSIVQRRCRWLAALGAAVLLAACGGGDSASVSGSPQSLLANTLTGFTGHGTWWNPAEPGSGFVFEAQGATGVITFFSYEDSGKPVWYSGAGTFSLREDGKYTFAATLYLMTGGQAATSTEARTPQRTAVGSASVVFDGLSAQVQAGGRNYVASKFNASTSTDPRQPEAGIYWNAGESGRGYTIEVANNVVSIGVFHYDANGEPTWNLIVGDISSGRLSAPFTSFFGGQTLNGGFRPAQTVATTQQFQISFSASCQGEIQFPGMAPVKITRFPFGGLAAGAECRSATPAPSGSTPGLFY